MKAIDVATDLYLTVLQTVKDVMKKQDTFTIHITPEKGTMLIIKLSKTYTHKYNMEMGDHFRPNGAFFKNREDIFDIIERELGNWEYGWGHISSEYATCFMERTDDKELIHVYAY
jgi:hypothetical protein